MTTVRIITDTGADVTSLCHVSFRLPYSEGNPLCLKPGVAITTSLDNAVLSGGMLKEEELTFFKMLQIGLVNEPKFGVEELLVYPHYIQITKGVAFCWRPIYVQIREVLQQSALVGESHVFIRSSSLLSSMRVWFNDYLLNW